MEIVLILVLFGAYLFFNNNRADTLRAAQILMIIILYIGYNSKSLMKLDVSEMVFVGCSGVVFICIVLFSNTYLNMRSERTKQ